MVTDRSKAPGEDRQRKRDFGSRDKPCGIGAEVISVAAA